jgi:hypothetical protein
VSPVLIRRVSIRVHCVKVLDLPQSGLVLEWPPGRDSRKPPALSYPLRTLQTCLDKKHALAVVAVVVPVAVVVVVVAWAAAQRPCAGC